MTIAIQISKKCLRLFLFLHSVFAKWCSKKILLKEKSKRLNLLCLLTGFEMFRFHSRPSSRSQSPHDPATRSSLASRSASASLCRTLSDQLTNWYVASPFRYLRLNNKSRIKKITSALKTWPFVEWRQKSFGKCVYLLWRAKQPSLGSQLCEGPAVRTMWHLSQG